MNDVRTSLQNIDDTAYILDFQNQQKHLKRWVSRPDCGEKLEPLDLRPWVNGTIWSMKEDLNRRDFLKNLGKGVAAGTLAASGVGGLDAEKAEAQEVSLDAAAKEILGVMKEMPEYKSLYKPHQFFVANCVAAYMLSAGDDGAKLASGFEPLQNKAALDLFIVPAYRAFLTAEMGRRAEQRAGDEIPDALKDIPNMPNNADLAAMYMEMHVPKVEAIVDEIVKYAERKAPRL